MLSCPRSLPEATIRPFSTDCYERAMVVYDDPKAAKFVWGAAFHWYMTHSYDNVRRVAEAWPEKGLLFTEGCNGAGPGMKHWNGAERYGTDLIHDFNNGAHGWTDWNLALDERGGPNHVSNFCSAPVIVDTERKTFELLPSYFALKYASLAARPGSRRIACATSRDELEAMAFLQPGGAVGVFALNRSDEDFAFSLKMEGRGAPVASPAHSMLLIRVPPGAGRAP